MKRIKITVMKITTYPDLIKRYENPIEHACLLKVGDSFIAEGNQKPEGLCESAWGVMFPFVDELAKGGGDFFDGWMKNKHSAMVSCNDGFRPVTFYLEALDEEAL